MRAVSAASAAAPPAAADAPAAGGGGDRGETEVWHTVRCLALVLTPLSLSLSTLHLRVPNYAYLLSRATPFQATKA